MQTSHDTAKFNVYGRNYNSHTRLNYFRTRASPHTHRPLHMPPASKRFRSGGHTLVRTHSQPPTQHSPPPASHSQSASAQSMAAPIETQSRGSCRWGCRRRRRSWRRRWWSRAITNTVDQERCFQYIPRARVFTGTCLNMESAYVTSLYPRETVAARTVQPWHSGRGSGSCDPLRLLHRRRSSVTS